VSASVVGCGAVGARVARHLLSTSTVERVALHDIRTDRAVSVARTLGDAAVIGSGEPSGDAVVLAGPTGGHVALARAALGRGQAVVSLTDSLEEAQALLALDPIARAAGRALVVGAGFSPGLTCVLARFAATGLDVVDEVHVAKLGTGGPACARQHHRALKGFSLDRRDGQWIRRSAGSGRELLWFPSPVDAHDCYRAALPEAVLLAPWFPEATRITGRMAATRRDRLTAQLPMLRRPHPEGISGAVRVEVWGRRGGAQRTVIMGAAERPAVAAATVAGLAVGWALSGRLEPGASGLAQLGEAAAREAVGALMTRGIRTFVFDGQPRRVV
jgi:hypothetical protein